ncbi:MAG TPA: HNH endonuclease signature motif containing protein [Acidimicrobiales bacterium]|nr:HNH endonuclease signature motif containing protein [Acidimicrobiales bacterium]
MGAGLGARLESVRTLLAVVVGELDPGCLTGAGAAELYRCFAGLERLSMAGKTVLAPRVEASGVWRDAGHRDAATMLAQLEGVSTGQARTTLVAGRRLESLPGTEDVLRAGRLSGPKVSELTGAGILDPARESDLLDGADELPLYALRERCSRSRATSGANDPLATVRRIRAGRHFSSWTDPEGAFCYQGRDTADRGAQILSHLGAVATRLRRARAAAAPEATAPEATEPERALRADAFFALVTRRHPDAGAEAPPGPDRSDPPVPRDPPDLPDPHDHDPDIDPDTLGPDVSGQDGSGQEVPGQPGGEQHDGVDAGSLIDRPPACSVVVRVDLAALLRGHARDGELCEIDNQGPIPVPMARDLANDSFLRLVFHQAGDIRAVSHLGRTINRCLRTALVHRDTTCVVPGCGVSFGLEVDHLVPFAEGGPTELDNLALLCHHHHYLKTYENWVLTRTGTDDTGGPRWWFAPQPPFGQEPGLGIDTAEERDRWHRRDE